MYHGIRLKLLVQVFLEFFERRLTDQMDDIIAQKNSGILYTCFGAGSRAMGWVVYAIHTETFGGWSSPRPI